MTLGEAIITAKIDVAKLSKGMQRLIEDWLEVEVEECPRMIRRLPGLKDSSP